MANRLQADTGTAQRATSQTAYDNMRKAYEAGQISLSQFRGAFPQGSPTAPQPAQQTQQPSRQEQARAASQAPQGRLDIDPTDQNTYSQMKRAFDAGQITHSDFRRAFPDGDPARTQQQQAPAPAPAPSRPSAPSAPAVQEPSRPSVDEIRSKLPKGLSDDDLQRLISQAPQSADFQPTPFEMPDMPENTYLEHLQNMEFDYDPNYDAQYLQSASNLENQIVQSMVGRGGMYSSVAQSALSSNLMGLQVQFREMRHSEFLQERQHTFQMAQFTENMRAQHVQEALQVAEHQRAWQQQQFGQEMAVAQHQLDLQRTAFDQQFQLVAFEWQQEMDMFNQEMQRAQLRFQQAEAAYRRQQDEYNRQMQEQQLLAQQEMAMYEQQQQDRFSQVSIDMALVEADNERHQRYLQEWQNSGVVQSSEVANYYGVSMGTPINSPGSVMAINSKGRMLENSSAELISLADAYNYDQLGVDFIKNISRMPETQTVGYSMTRDPMGGTSTTVRGDIAYSQLPENLRLQNAGLR